MNLKSFVYVKYFTAAKTEKTSEPKSFKNCLQTRYNENANPHKSLNCGDFA
jgi:hypothetical protein